MPKTEVFYSWFELRKVEGESEPRMLVPHSDPYEFEFPIDFMFDTPELAEAGLVDWGVEEEAIDDKWILCKITKEPIKVLGE